ncbi:MAG: A/G-specific adenine glycosylase [Bacteroidota bacterium]
MKLSHVLIDWYQEHKRDLPWRHTRDPYLIWLSEIILQQTRVEQGLPYYVRFTERYPTVFDLAEASEKEVLKLWQGLGYYSRARNLHATARLVVKEYKGIFPDTYDGLIRLKGIGQYTAGAIASFAYNEPKPVVDGNVYRLLSRYYGIRTPVDSARGKKQFYSLAADLLDKERPGLFNQAIMEFGARQCIPRNPACAVCPLSASCAAYSGKLVERLPVKGKKANVRNRHFYYFVLRHRGKPLLRRRKESDIWKGLYDFPLVEKEKNVPVNKLLGLKETRELLGGKKFLVRSVSGVYKHVLSHQHLHAVFIEVSLKGRPAVSGLTPASSKLALPRLIEKYLQAHP